MDKIDYNDIEDLLKEIEPLIQQKEERLKRGELFNIFNTLGVDHYEEQHSTIIANFLNPQESHGQKDKFLKLFLEEIGDDTEIETSNSKIYTEFKTDYGRIDIFIENKEQKKAIIIENKVYAGDQEEQLIRYSTFLKNSYDGNGALYYLTLDGKEASEYSTGGNKEIKYNRISYSKHILNWIVSCIKESTTTPLIYATLEQYKNLIEQLTNIGMNKNLLKIMAEHPKEVKAIYDAQNEFAEYVYKTYVQPAFQKFAKENNLVFNDEEISDSDYYANFFFYNEEWRKSMAIYLYQDTGDKFLKLGISSTKSKKFKGNTPKLDCLSDDPDEDFPYGFVKLYDKMSPQEIYVDMVQKDFSKKIIELVSNVLDEIKKKKIPL
ncbi:MAG: PD-(D/E)XK nuclease family protein [Bacteroidales bacterium]|nr:PD-(D/E)XK nuclease family protein [Bacteroidales bacterium]